jgi:hypothetical protein
MIVPIVALLFSQDSLTSDLDRLARARDVPGLTAKAPNAWKGFNPFNVIKTNGAYDCGRFGWRALTGTAPWGQKYIVFSTPLTSEDVGERLFETDGTKLTKYIDEREDFGWRIEKHSLTVSVRSEPTTDVARGYKMTGDVDITDRFTVRHQGAEGPLIFRMGPNYKVRLLTKFDSADSVQWIQVGGIVFIHGANDGDTYVVSYEGKVDKPGYAGSISQNEALLTNDYWYPMIGRKPSPYGMNVFTPGDWVVVGQGELEGTAITPQGSRTTAFRMDLPVTYWSLNMAPYKVVEEKIDGRTYKSWSNALSPQLMNLQPKFFPLIIDTYEAAFAKFPFSGYGSCMTPAYGGGALEAYSFVTSGYYSGEDSHEIGHTWFGGIVNNTYLTSMWNESFAVWCEGFFGRNAKLGNREERERAFVQTPAVDDDYNAAPLNNAPPDIGPVASDLGYGKGAFVLQMLEQELGTETFVKACRDWLAKQDRTRGAEWEDFEAAVKRVESRDVKWFFDQWVRRPGYADFSLEQVRYENGFITGGVIFKGAPYRITCEALVEAAGKRTFTTFDLKPGKFKIPVAGKPSMVSFDPWRRIVRKIDGSETPTEINSALRTMQRVTYSGRQGWLPGVGGNPTTKSGTNLNGLFLVGTPQDDPALKPLFDKVGFQVQGNKLTYKGTVVELDKGGAIAIVDLAGGGRCAIGVGTTLHGPNVGRARLAVFDELGRFLRGVTDPKTQGPLTFKL